MKILQAPWDTSEPIEKLLVRVCKCQCQLRNDEAMSDISLVDHLLLTITESTILRMAVHEWDMTAILLQTYMNFAKHFIAANQEWLGTTTMEQASYHATNNVVPPAADPPANNRISRNRTPANPAAPRPYCHTHGVPVGKPRFGNTYRHLAPGHCYEATFTNRMGGSNEIQQPNSNSNRNNNRYDNRNFNRSNSNSNKNRCNNNNNNTSQQQ
jgi:hypothetical protein